MTGNSDSLIINKFWLETRLQIRYMRKNVVVYLLFTLMLTLIGITNFTTMVIVSQSLEHVQMILFLMPHPILFIILAISAGLQFYILRRLKILQSDITSLDLGFDSSSTTYGMHVDTFDDPISEGDEIVPTQVSVADINYDMINLMEVSLRFWPILSIFFAVFIIGNIVSLICFSSQYLDYVPGSLLILDLTIITMVIFLYYIQTKDWLIQRRRLKNIEILERTISEELNM